MTGDIRRFLPPPPWEGPPIPEAFLRAFKPPPPWEGPPATNGHKARIYGAWVWRVPLEISEEAMLFSELREFPPPPAWGWKLVRVEPGRFRSVDEAVRFVPEAPGTYAVAIGQGLTMEWKLVRRRPAFPGMRKGER